VKWLDLRGSGLSVLERLIIEELLWKDSSTGSWLIAGHHDPTRHRYLQTPPPVAGSNLHNTDAVIVMGIGGKPHALLDLDLVRRDNVQVLRRFSGGGTVVLDADSIWTTVIGRNSGDDGSDEEDPDEGPLLLPPDRRFPRPIMEWSMSLFGPVVHGLGKRQQQRCSRSNGRKKTMVLDAKSCAVENTGRVITIPMQPRDEREVSQPQAGDLLLSLRENDYVVNETLKVAGNAQSIGKSGWLHHTSWLWDYSRENMSYLSIPDKRPAYRENRSHEEFLGTLRSRLPALTKNDFYESLRIAASSRFDLTAVALPAVMSALREQHGDVQSWMRNSRTRIVRDL
jgi:lipoate-protein ligase A